MDYEAIDALSADERSRLNDLTDGVNLEIGGAQKMGLNQSISRVGANDSAIVGFVVEYFSRPPFRASLSPDRRTITVEWDDLSGND